MLLLLPPSESKRDGGAQGTSLDLASLSYPDLTRSRRMVLAGTRRLAKNLTTMAAVLRTGPGLRSELLRNRELGTSPTMPAIDRYTGVLYEALGATTLGTEARTFAAGRVVIHSPLFGLVDAQDLIPAYRLSHDSRLPGVSLKSVWRTAIGEVIGLHNGLVIDLRSEAYAELGPVPPQANSVFLRLLSPGSDGVVRALNHFNKKGKGGFVRALLQTGQDFDTVDGLVEWATGSGFHLSAGAAGELDLVV